MKSSPQSISLITKIASAIGVMTIVVGCASITQKQDESLASFRDVIVQETKLSDSEREALYQDQLWYSHDAWKKRDPKANLQKGELETIFLECLKASEAIENGISAKIGGKDPVQFMHARATVEICMIGNGFVTKDERKTLICEADEYDVLPICLMARYDVLEQQAQ